MDDPHIIKDLIWIASSRKGLKAFPDDVRRVIGYALYLAQKGKKAAEAKVLTGFGGAGVLEIVDDYQTDTYRAVYTLKFSYFVYVLHAFEASRRRLRDASIRNGTLQMKVRSKTSKHGKSKAADDLTVEVSSGNVFADLGLPDADELLLKAELTSRIAQLIEKKGWTQSQTAERINLDQPKVSRLLRGELSGFSVDRLLAILNRLGHSVEVRISAKERAPEKSHTRVSMG